MFKALILIAGILFIASLVTPAASTAIGKRALKMEQLSDL